jgi:hypothetical protein
MAEVHLDGQRLVAAWSLSLTLLKSGCL